MRDGRRKPPLDRDLRQAVEAGNQGAIEQLIEQGADPNKADALLAAINSGRREILLYLLTHGADPNAWAQGRDRQPEGAMGSPLFQAAKRGDAQLLKDLKEHGADINAASLERHKPAGDTALIAAARSGELGAVRLLLQFGADVNHPNPEGDAALMSAFYAPRDAVEIATVLLQHGADPDLRDLAGKSARETASWYGAPGIREAIEKVRPSLPFSRPEDVEHIRQVLLFKAGCDLVAADYERRTRAVYQRWRAPRSRVIENMETSAEFQAQRAAVVQSVKQALSRPEDTAEYRQSAAQYHLECDKQLIQEFADPSRH